MNQTKTEEWTENEKRTTTLHCFLASSFYFSAKLDEKIQKKPVCDIVLPTYIVDNSMFLSDYLYNRLYIMKFQDAISRC